MPIEKPLEAPVEKSIEKFERKMPEIKEEKGAIAQIKGKISKILPITQEEKEEALTTKDEELIMIENILSKDTEKYYNQLAIFKQKEFQKKGEEIALKIKKILRQTKVRANEIFELVKNWLKILPKISTYFLDQEAKIKTDEILQMKREGQEIE